MTKPTILVTGATGKTGGAVTALLRLKDWSVRAIVHSRDSRSERLDRLGVETVVADLYDPDQILAAMKGTTRAYYLPFFGPYMIQSAAAFAIAAQESRLESIVQMSQWLASPVHPSLATRQTWLVDRLFAMLPGISHTIINPGWFADNFLRTMDFAALLGVFPFVTGDSRSAPISTEDIARVVAAALMDPQRHAGKSYRPTGPALVSGYNIAEIIQKVLGSRILPVPLPLWMLLKVARLQGVDGFTMSGFRYYVQEHRRGTFGLNGGTNEVVREVTGTPAEDMEATVRRYAAMPFARRTAANRLRAISDFGRIPFFPGYNLDRYDSRQLHPMPPHTQLDIDNPRWLAEHNFPAQSTSAAPVTGQEEFA